jgi:hypothetical protein
MAYQGGYNAASHVYNTATTDAIIKAMYALGM